MRYFGSLLCVLVLVASAPGVVLGAAGAGSAFTYQGRLYDGGSPAEGGFDLTFSLFDGPGKGTRQIGESIVRQGVAVAGGYFTVELDFGLDGDRFNGLTRYLAIEVMPTGSSGRPILLAPRQKITPAPYARSAFSAQECEPLNYMPDFVVRIDVDGMPSQYFHHFNWIESNTEIVPYRDGTSNLVRKLAGMADVGDIELTRFVTGNSSLRGWLNIVREGGQARREVTVYILDREGNAVDAWQLSNVWPSRLWYETDDKFATVVEKVVLVSEGISRIHIADIGFLPDEWYPGQQPVVRLPVVLEIPGEPMRFFDKMTGLGWDIQVVTYQDGGDLRLRKRQGEIKALDTRLSRAVENADEGLWSWRADVINGRTPLKNAAVIMRGSAGADVLVQILRNSWCAEFMTTHDAALNRVEESVVLAVESVQ
jgi:phage tail-like protein